MRYENCFWPNGNIQTSVLKDNQGNFVKWRAWEVNGKELNGKLTRHDIQIILEQDEEYRQGICGHCHGTSADPVPLYPCQACKNTGRRIDE